jgi:3-hydroxybutyryl-CoA dehydrogenase
MISYQLIDTGNSRSFPQSHSLRDKAQNDGDAVVIIGESVDAVLRTFAGQADKVAIVIELGTESLGVHTGESRGDEGSNVLGFSRFRRLGGAHAPR